MNKKVSPFIAATRQIVIVAIFKVFPCSTASLSHFLL